MYIPFIIDFTEFLKKIKSPVVVDDELKALWQEEIYEFASREQVIVKL